MSGDWTMPEKIAFQRKTVAGHFVIMSEDLPGFQVSEKDEADAERVLPILLGKYLEIVGQKSGKTAKIAGVTLEQV